MALMRDPNGKEHDIVPDGVEALEALGWTRTETADTAARGDAKPAARRTSRNRAKSE